MIFINKELLLCLYQWLNAVSRDQNSGKYKTSTTTKIISILFSWNFFNTKFERILQVKKIDIKLYVIDAFAFQRTECFLSYVKSLFIIIHSVKCRFLATPLRELKRLIHSRCCHNSVSSSDITETQIAL